MISRHFIQEQRGRDYSYGTHTYTLHLLYLIILNMDIFFRVAYIITYACMLWSEGCLHLLSRMISPTLLILAVYCVLWIYKSDV